MSLKDKVKALLDQDYNRRLFWYAEMYDGDSSDIPGKPLAAILGTEHTNNIKVSPIAQKGGEGKGEEYWHVLKLTEADEEVHVRLNASYSSYDGPTYEGYEFVKPLLITRVEYVGVK